MKFISTRGGSAPVGASDAVRAGLAPDGGLYVPATFPVLDAEGLEPGLPFPTRAVRVLRPFFAGDPAAPLLKAICRGAFDFPVPLRWRGTDQAVLELFHGPTLAFKDIGARFLAEFLERTEAERQGWTKESAGNTFLRASAGEGPVGSGSRGPAARPPLTVLVATSGDTGGAVAAAFHRKRCARVRVFFPQDGVSGRQRAQLTCWGDNIASYAVCGTFDDCQRLVKHAFSVPGLGAKVGLTSANSINLGRLLPQAVYYVHAAVAFREKTGLAPVIVVPTGNVGNVTAAFWAKATGAPIARLVLAVNANRTIPDFLADGEYRPRPSVPTLANAMDVGNPSNMERLRHLFPGLDLLRRELQAFSVSDDQIRDTIRSCHASSGEVLCPHTAVAERVRLERLPGVPAMIVATAHPAKFEEVVEPLIGRALEVPPGLADLLARPRREIPLDPDPTRIDWEALAEGQGAVVE